jgi:hypothetical protein
MLRLISRPSSWSDCVVPAQAGIHGLSRDNGETTIREYIARRMVMDSRFPRE